MSKAVLGQTLTTDTSGATGTYAAGQVHEEVRQDLVSADAADLAAVLRDQLIRPLVGFNFGWEAPLPALRFYRKKDEDLKLLSETYRNLAALGMPLTQEYLADRFGIPLPQENETVLQKPPEKTGRDPGEPPAAMKAVLTDWTVTAGDVKALAVAQELENLTQAAHQEAQEYLGRMLQPVARLIEGGASLGAIQEELLRLYGPLDKRDLAVLLGQVRILANLRGRVEGSGQ
jgi:phage gp29-like protein